MRGEHTKRGKVTKKRVPLEVIERAHPGGEGRIFVGNVEVLALTDGEGPFPFPLTQLFPTVPAKAWAPCQQRYPEAFAGPDGWHNRFGCFLVRSQGRTILVDTGKGSTASNPGFVNAFGGGMDGQLLGVLQAAGVSPKEIDIVFFTHLHPDHVGWNVSRGSPNPRATFPWARYVINRADWETFKRPDIQSFFPFQYWEETLGPLETLGVLDLIEGETSLTSEITAIPTPGHTPGHMSVGIVSEGQRAYVMGDLAIHPAQLTETDWSDSWTMNPTQAGEVRRKFLNRVESEEATLLACHFPGSGIGRLERVEGRLYWQGL